MAAGKLISAIKLADVPLPDLIFEVCERLMGYAIDCQLPH